MAREIRQPLSERLPSNHLRLWASEKRLANKPNSHLQAFFIVTSERRPVAFVGFLSRTILIIKINK